MVVLKIKKEITQKKIIKKKEQVKFEDYLKYFKNNST